MPKTTTRTATARRKIPLEEGNSTKRSPLGEKDEAFPEKKTKKKKKMIKKAWSVCVQVAEKCQRYKMWFFAPRQVMEGGLTVYKGSLLAEGGFSYVYVGYDAETNKELVLKEVRIEEPEQMEAVMREVEAHKKFDHRHLMPLLDFLVMEAGPRSRVAIFAFPYCHRGSLRNLIDKNVLAFSKAAAKAATKAASKQKKINFAKKSKKKSLDDFIEDSILEKVDSWNLQQFAALFRGVCLGTEAIHAKGMSHRDIKPENVLVNDDGTALLMDFGSMAPSVVSLETRKDCLSLQDEAATNSTMPYRAPELWEPEVGNPLDAAKSDVWSLGCLLWAMAFGYSPFEAEFTKDSIEPKIVETS